MIRIWIWAVENLGSSHHVSVVRDLIQYEDGPLEERINDRFSCVPTNLSKIRLEDEVLGLSDL